MRRYAFPNSPFLHFKYPSLWVLSHFSVENLSMSVAVSCESHLGSYRGLELSCVGFPPGTKVYCCCYDGCDYRTIRPGHLRRHERTHTKEKPYCCKYCSYQASRSDHLRRHEKIHERSLSRRSRIAHQLDHCISTKPEPLSNQTTLSIADGGMSYESYLISSKCSAFIHAWFLSRCLEM